jgi:hypothetical protein
MNKNLTLRLQEMALDGAAPSSTGKGGSKAAQLEAWGWRILPIPQFWGASQLWHDGKGNGNPPSIDFRHPREWLVIPPDGVDVPATKISGRICAVRWGYERASSLAAGASPPRERGNDDGSH